MNTSTIIGIVVTVSLLLAGIMWGSPLIVFFNTSAVMIAVGGTVFMLLATHGRDALLLCSGMGRWFLGGGSTPWNAEDCRKAAHIANTGGGLAIMMGALGCLLGLITMLQNMDDLSAIGPAMAVALLTVFYAMAMNLLFFVPMSRHFAEAAVDAETGGAASG